MDGLIIFGKNLSDIDDLEIKLKAEYEIKDLGELSYFLGVQVHCNKARKLIHINQSGYNRTILENFSMADSNPVKTPLPGGSHLMKATTTDVLTDQKEYHSMVGSLMYAKLTTRPDLARCIQQISQYSQKPTVIHQKGAKHALRYFNGTIDQGITFDGNVGMKLECWSNTSW